MTREQALEESLKKCKDLIGFEINQVSTEMIKGLPVIKFDDFSRTTNVTLGLPIIRVSVDHGTATELVGTGKADISSFAQALKIARDISKSEI